MVEIVVERDDILKEFYVEDDRKLKIVEVDN